MDQIAPDQETRGRPMSVGARRPGLNEALRNKGASHGQTGKGSTLGCRREREPEISRRSPIGFHKPEPPLTARLIVRRTSVKSGRRHFYLYDIEFGDELIVIGSADHECDLARALLSRGVTGTAAIFDGTDRQAFGPLSTLRRRHCSPFGTPSGKDPGLFYGSP